MRFYLQKVMFYVVAFWAALTLNFFIPRLMPGNPVDVMLAKLSTRKGPVTPAAARLSSFFSAPTPVNRLWSQYWDYLINVTHGDLGVSVTYYPASVGDIIGQTLPWTITLIGLATIISFILGIGLGQLAGWKRGSWLDSLVPATTLLAAVPYFWLALILVYLFASHAALVPAPGRLRRHSGPGWNWASSVGASTTACCRP